MKKNQISQTSKVLGLALVALSLSFTACQSSHGFKGKISNKGTNAVVFVDRVSATGADNIGSANIADDGSFEIKYESGQPSVYRLRVGAAILPMIVLEPSNVEVNFDLANPFGYEVKNAPASNLLKSMTLARTMPQVSDFRNYIDTVSNSLAAWYMVRFVNAMDGDNLQTYKKVQEKLVRQYPESDYTHNFSIQISTLETQLSQQPIRIGKPLPEISLPNMAGKTMSLSALKGKVVLVDFWASWCGPCRASNPELVSIYNKYKDQGFTVYSISLDEKKEAWAKAIAADNLSWDTHVSELKGWYGAINMLLGIESIPRAILLDKNGNVAADNLRGADLEQKIQSLLASTES